ncbi:methyl-accepting chemotaxis protein [Paenibacillus algorifonticola]|uniref:Methyl-accepting chemotaxis protein n=1 Tax=Paenibacillus algorifonticola TaxID=684063 RepID=A0A1I2D5E0_9BACL|nr:methyl-accepting chemotaxis protein [Paenibacillus algorifonticola]SFE75715.1 methyl-accepting chemotaxis protein [Paenibacillus algorifonticola]
MRFSIRFKLLAGFISVALLLVLTGVIAIFAMSGMGDKAREMNDRWMPSVALLAILNGEVSDIERLALNIIVETDADEVDKMDSALNDLLDKIKTEREQYAAMAQTEEEKMLFEEFGKSLDLYLAKMPEFVAYGKENNFDRASELHTTAYPLWYTANENITKLIQLGIEGSTTAADESVDLAVTSTNAITAVVIFAVLLALVIAYLIAQMVSKAVLKVSRAAEQIAGGDLTGEMIVIKNRDEIGDLAKSFNAMTHSLREVINSVSMTSSLVAASSEELMASAEQNSKASEQISETVEELAVGTSEQVDMVKRSSQAIEEMSIGVEQIALRAQSVSTSALDAAAQSSEGNRTIQQAVVQMDSIQRSISSLAELVTGLGERSDEIGKITDVITAIATQTNLLALNAAIEAARAGDHGRGFAVVADEVRKLAEQSSASALQITGIVSVIQKDTINAVQAVTMNRQEVSQGIAVVTNAGEAFEQILDAVNKVAGEIQEVSASAEQMAASTDEVVGFVKQISHIAEEASGGAHNVSAATEEQLASMEEIASSAASLSSMAEELQDKISRFKV